MERREKVLEIIESLKYLSLFLSDTRDKIAIPHGLTHLQAIVLLDIYHNPSQTKITDICKRLSKTTNNISPLVNRLMEKELIYKKQSSNDNRVFEIYLTDKGQDILDKIITDVINFAIPLFSNLGDSDFIKLESSLSKLRKVCEEV